MIIPRHSEKIKSDFETYLDELQTSFCEKTEEHFAKGRVELFKYAYPLFVLLESLVDAEDFINPSTSIILQEALYENEQDIIQKSFRNLYASNNYTQKERQLLFNGMKKKQFTPYFHEMYSDILILLNSYYTNNYRGAHIASRTVLEDLYRHLYYKDHPEEFYAIQSGRYDEHDFSLSPVKFREYLPKTSFLKLLGNVDKNFSSNKKKIEDNQENNYTTVFTWNNLIYSKTSAHVHASKIEFMGNFQKNMDMKFDDASSKILIDTAKEIITLAIIFLICAHREDFLRLSDYAKSLVLDTFDNKTRHNFRKYLNV